jgi:hypothetical protein
VAAARKNIRKAITTDRNKRTIAHLPPQVRTELGQKGAAAVVAPFWPNSVREALAFSVQESEGCQKSVLDQPQKAAIHHIALCPCYNLEIRA